ncbi:MAG TPA: UDP-N-acetylmuramoyl-L-alanyl-D-glutamate--2,6-diaminopimelate ligase [Spirochaetia bacterium]|nr:UDP-N-acetylmuramoyl-L-alanyl-D-glutamate--2,6-diaminopimelate ligase [Spirochaetia bacterium]
MVRAGSIDVMREKSLRRIFAGLPVLETQGDMDRLVRGLAYDSRDVGSGFLFVAMDGHHSDGHRFIDDAVARGASAVLHRQPVEGPAPGVTYIRVENPRTSLSPVAAEFFGHPSRSLGVIGVTGTDGKSSTVWFIAQLLSLLNRRAGFLSTVSFQTAEQIVKNPFRQSTPEASEIHGMLRDMVDIGKEFAVVEATSHGLSSRNNRLGDVIFDAAVLTNVTHEHLEFHGSFEQYRSDKANLFRSLSIAERKRDPRGTPLSLPRFGVVNADDPSAAYFRAASRVPVFSYGLRSKADLCAGGVQGDMTGTCLILTDSNREAPARLRIPGPFWVENTLAACLAVARLLDLDPLSLAPLLQELSGVKGRMESVDLGQPFTVIVDYAHTPAAFERLFPWVRKTVQGRITAVFGSAGERDRAKRPMQGEAASRYADTLVITDEDPRGEDRVEILEQIAAGCANRKRGDDLFLVPDRPEAIRLAFQKASPGDVVLLLGKGHEGSIIGPSGPAPWDERTEAERALRSLGYGT